MELRRALRTGDADGREAFLERREESADRLVAEGGIPLDLDLLPADLRSVGSAHGVDIVDHHLRDEAAVGRPESVPMSSGHEQSGQAQRGAAPDAAQQGLEVCGNVLGRVVTEREVQFGAGVDTGRQFEMPSRVVAALAPPERDLRAQQAQLGGVVVLGRQFEPVDVDRIDGRQSRQVRKRPVAGGGILAFRLLRDGRRRCAGHASTPSPSMSSPPCHAVRYEGVRPTVICRYRAKGTSALVKARFRGDHGSTRVRR